MSRWILIAALVLGCSTPAGVPTEKVQPEPNWCPADTSLRVDRLISDDGTRRTLAVGCLDSATRPHGPGMIWNANTGQLEVLMFFEHGVPHGPAMAWRSNGRLFKTSLYVHGKYEGEFLMWYENGQLAVRGSYQNDVRHGPWMKWNQDGQLRWEGQFRDGELLQNEPLADIPE